MPTGVKILILCICLRCWDWTKGTRGLSELSPAFFFLPICGFSELCEGARRLEGGAKIALGLVVCSQDPVRNLAPVPLFIPFLIAVTKHLAESAYGQGIHFGSWFL